MSQSQETAAPTGGAEGSASTGNPDYTRDSGMSVPTDESDSSNNPAMYTLRSLGQEHALS